MRRAGFCYKWGEGVASHHCPRQASGPVRTLAAMTGNAPADLLTELFVAQYTGLVWLTGAASLSREH